MISRNVVNVTEFFCTCFVVVVVVVVVVVAAVFFFFFLLFWGGGGGGGFSQNVLRLLTDHWIEHLTSTIATNTLVILSFGLSYRFCFV